MVTFHEGLHFLSFVEITGLGNPYVENLMSTSQQCVGISNDITSQAAPDTMPMQRPLTADNFGIIDAVVKGEILVNVPKLLCYTNISLLV